MAVTGRRVIDGGGSYWGLYDRARGPEKYEEPSEEFASEDHRSGGAVPMDVSWVSAASATTLATGWSMRIRRRM